MTHALLKGIAAFDTLTGFDRWGPDANPVIRLAKRRPGRLSLRRALWLAFGFGLAGAALASWQLLTASTNDLSFLDWAWLIVGWSFHALTPFVASYWGVQHTRRLQQSAHFNMLYLTPLPNHRLIEGFTFETLHSMRYTLLLMVGMMPALIVKTLHMLIVFDTWIRVRYPYTSPDLYIRPPTRSSMVIPTLYALAVAVGLWGMTLCGAIIGVRTALLRTNHGVALITAPSMILVILLCPCVCLWSLPLTLVPSLPVCGPLLAVLIPLFMMIAPPVLAINTVLQTAQRWRR